MLKGFKHMLGPLLKRFSLADGFLGWAVLTATLVFLLGILVMMPIYLPQDDYWVLYMADQTMSGAKPYVDFIEINPPLIIWLNIPPVWFADITGLSIEAAFKIYIFTLILGVLSFCMALLKRFQLSSASILFVALTAALTLVPGGQFGQREHILVILCLPYLFLIAARAEKIHIPISWIITGNIMAAIGFCIKPYFVFIPLFCELFLLIKLGWATFKRFEPYLLGALGTLYLVSIFIFTPEYISGVIGHANIVYQAGIGADSAFMFSILKPMIFCAIIGLAVFLLLKKRLRDIPGLYLVFIIMILTSVMSFIVQFKGLPNHTYPIRAFGLILMIVGAAEIFNLTKSPALRLGAVLLLITPIHIFAIQHIQHAPRSVPHTDYFKSVIQDYPDVDSVFIMSIQLGYGFPLINHTDLTWGSRYPSLWITPGVQKLKAADMAGPDVLEVERYSHQVIADDFIKLKPDLVFVHVVKDKKYFEGIEYSYIEDYSQNSDFKKVWSRYERVKEGSVFDVYRLRPAN